MERRLESTTKRLLRTPERRTCERCERTERWDDDRVTWTVDSTGADNGVGEPCCIHEWDIDGSFDSTFRFSQGETTPANLTTNDSTTSSRTCEPSSSSNE